MANRDEDEMAAFYENPENRRTRGRGYKRAGTPPLSSHTPVRFEAGTIAAIRRFSDEDGITVSAWVRRVVDAEIQRRLTLMTSTATAWGAQVSLQIPGRPAPATATLSFGVLRDLRPVA